MVTFKGRGLTTTASYPPVVFPWVIIGLIFHWLFLLFFKGTGHYWSSLKIIVSIKHLLWSNVVFEREVVSHKHEAFFEYLKTHNFVQQLCFFFHYSLSTLTINWVKMFTDLLFYTDFIQAMVFHISRVWVWVQVVTLVSLSKKLNHDTSSFGWDVKPLVPCFV